MPVVIGLMLIVCIPVAFFVGMIVAFDKARLRAVEDGQLIKDLRDAVRHKDLQQAQNEVYVSAIKSSLEDAHVGLQLALTELLKKDPPAQPLTHGSQALAMIRQNTITKETV